MSKPMKCRAESLSRAEQLGNIVDRLNPIADALERIGYPYLAEHIDSVADAMLTEQDTLANNGPAVFEFRRK